MHISDGGTLRHTRPVVAVVTIVNKQIIDQSVAVDSFTLKVQIFNHSIADISEQRLSSCRNRQHMIIAVKNTTERFKLVCSHILWRVGR